MNRITDKRSWRLQGAPWRSNAWGQQELVADLQGVQQELGRQFGVCQKNANADPRIVSIHTAVAKYAELCTVLNVISNLSLT